MPLLGTIESLILVAGGFIYLTTCLWGSIGLFRAVRRTTRATPRVSVVIAARNEAGSIGRLLDDLLAQDYPSDRMEIVAVDDASEDATGAIIRAYADKDRRIRYAGTLGSSSPYTHKKRAVHEGILSSTGNVILTVDADCRVSPGWICGMMAHFTDGIDLVAGAVIIEGRGFLAGLERLEFAGIQALAAGLMNTGFPITCNGANLAYRRSAFERVGGFGTVGKLVSGDDDLLMQKIAAGDPSRVIFITARETAVRVSAAGSFPLFFAKRARWVSKTGAYPSLPARSLAVLTFAFFLAIPAAFLTSLAGWTGWGPLLLGYGMKTAGDLAGTSLGLARSGEMRLLALFPLAELFHAPYVLAIALRGYFGTFEWRGRRTGAYAEGGTAR